MSSKQEATLPFIVAFYDPLIRAKDAEGRTLVDIIDFSDRELEYHHDFIQYLFPLPERSPINPYAPTITKEVRETFLARPELREQLRGALIRILEFYGFDIVTESAEQGSTVKIVPSDRFEQQSKATWRTRMDHNHLRITRILRSLRVLGLEAEAKAFNDALLENDRDERVSQRTRAFWERATERGLHLAPQDGDEAQGVLWLRES